MKSKDQNLESVLNKLRKLQNFYEGAKKINSEEEANVAAAAIQRLLTQYNLSMDEIGTDEEKTKDNVLEESMNGFTYKSIGGPWEYRLLNVICKWNFCKCLLYGGSFKRLIIFGKKENIETVKWLNSMLSERFVAFSKSRFKEFKQTMEFAMKPISIDKYQRSYLLGCAAGLDAKLQEENDIEKRKDQDFGTKVTALVVRNNAAIVEYIESKYSTTRAKARRENFDEARCRGFEDGRNTNLYKQVGSESKNQASKVNLLG